MPTLTDRNRALTEALGSSGRVFAAGLRGEVVALPPGTRPRQPDGSTTLMLWRGRPTLVCRALNSQDKS